MNVWCNSEVVAMGTPQLLQNKEIWP